MSVNWRCISASAGWLRRTGAFILGFPSGSSSLHLNGSPYRIVLRRFTEMNHNVYTCVSAALCTGSYSLQRNMCKRKSYACFQASTEKRMRTALFWVITQRVVVISSRRFGIKKKDSLSLKVESICCPETSARNYHYSFRNNPEERNSQIHKLFIVGRKTWKCESCSYTHGL